MSLSAAVVRELMAAGLTGDALVDACERIEAATPVEAGPLRTARQERNRRYYVSKRLKPSYSDVSDANSDGAHPPIKEKSPKPSKENYPLSSEPSVLRCESADEAFSEFWEAYPRRSGSNSRKNAESRFRAAIKSGVSAQTITDGARRYAAHCLAAGSTGTGFVKMAEAWINGRLWESDYSISVPRPPPRQAKRNTALDGLDELERRFSTDEQYQPSLRIAG